MKQLIVGLINIYRWFISPLLPSSCIFTPTCSSYAICAIKYYGPLKGLWMTIKRLSRCHNFGRNLETINYDPVLNEVADLDQKIGCEFNHKKKS